MNLNTFSQNPALFPQGQRFIDPEGRQVILHGVNLTCKDPKVGYLGPEGPEHFAALRRWGFNCLRLGIIWDGLEPLPGVYNDAYLQGIDQRIAWAKETGLYVFLDMHQDLYSVLFSDGAPAWATLTDDQPHIAEGGVWSDAYFTSPAVQAALDHFWQNSPAPDGLGLQEHYAQAWQYVARRYANEPAVIGYDLMNEPFPGSAAIESQMRMFARGAELLADLDGGPGQPPEELAMQWLDPDGRFQLLQRLQDADLFAQIIDVTHPLYARFEQDALMLLYQRVADAIRTVDPEHILFMNTSMGSNMGVYSALSPLQHGDKRDPAQAYAPHGYDLVVDTANLAHASQERVQLIFTRHGETAARLGMPMLVGEWGAFDECVPGTLPAVWMVSHLFESLLCSDTYWHDSPQLNLNPAFQAISRPYPERTAGKLQEYHYAQETGQFTCQWEEDASRISAPGVLYFPAWMEPGKIELSVDPAGSGWDFHLDEEGNGWVEIAPATHGTRRLSARLRP
jgi:endoglycosylceramidase